VRDAGGDPALQAFGQFFLRRPPVVGGELHGRQAGQRGAPGQGLDDLLLVLEVVIDVGLGDAEFGAEHVHGGADHAVAVEQVFGRAQDALALVRTALLGSRQWQSR
jgi:hypothetical protein